MLISLKEIQSYRLDATDGVMGTVKDFYFDDRDWVIRYLVADTGHWLPGRKVLISPASIGEPDWNLKSLPVSLTKKQIELSPSVDDEQPVSRQNEVMLAGYYGWPTYWAPLMGVAPAEVGDAHIEHREAERPQLVEARSSGKDPHLRSMNEAKGYHIQATDGEIGRIDDMIAETDDWALRYVVVDTSKWLPAIVSKRVLVSPAWATEVDWGEQAVHVELSCKSIEESPTYDPGQAINREYELRLYDYYGRPRYWETPAEAVTREQD